MSISDSLLDRVQKLLNQAQDPGIEGTPEAEIFLNKAIELMAKHGIEQAMLDSIAPKPVTPMHKIVGFTNPYASSKMRLYRAIVRSFRGQTIKLTGHKDTVDVFMMSTDEDSVELLYTQLLLHGVSVLEHTHIPEWINKRSFKVSWWLGYAGEVEKRLVAANKKAETEAEPGTALVLYDRSQMVRKDYEEAYPNRRNVGVRIGQSRGYSAGIAEGRRVNLGTPEVKNNRRAIR